MPAAATLSDGRAPAIGIDATTSHRWRTRRDRPSPSDPTTSTRGSVARVRSNRLVSPSSARPTTQQPSSLARARAAGRPGTDGQGDVLDRAGGGLGHRRGDVGRPAAGEDGAGGARPVGAAQEGAQVAGVGDPVEGEEERAGGRRRRRRRSGRRHRSSKSASGRGAAWARTPWGASVAASRSSTARAVWRIGHPPPLGLLHDLVEDGRRVDALGHPHVVDLPPAGPEQLGHRLATLDLLAAEPVRAGPTSTGRRPVRAASVAVGGGPRRAGRRRLRGAGCGRGRGPAVSCVRMGGWPRGRPRPRAGGRATGAPRRASPRPLPR